MQFYLRFQLYNDPSRQTYTQLNPDTPIDQPVEARYGQGVRVGDEANDANTWPRYRVAHILRVQQIVDPVDPLKEALLFEVFLAKQAEWHLYDTPYEVEMALAFEN
ncbi:hypothetical protein [Spirosoma koreense]